MYLTHGYSLQRLHKTRRFSLKEKKAVFLEKQKSIFSLVALSTLFAFSFRQNCESANRDIFGPTPQKLIHTKI